jgi:hypothetical protein
MMLNESDAILFEFRNWPYLKGDPDFGPKFKITFVKIGIK